MREANVQVRFGCFDGPGEQEGAGGRHMQVGESGQG